MNHWLLKSEPSTFSIDALAALPKRTTAWSGVRNYQARNMLRDSIRKGDLAFFYHSSCAEPGVAGIVSVVKSGYPETPDDPRWYVVDVKLKRKFARIITLDALRQHAADALAELVLLRRGNRLSVMPVTKKDWDFILTLE
jgi:predicted RNA-binding protein with PUA-like domain